MRRKYFRRLLFSPRPICDRATYTYQIGALGVRNIVQHLVCVYADTDWHEAPL